MLEAERAKDEIRDILSRMIGAEIRYVRMGYRVRPAPYGYSNEKIETSHCKRIILKPHPDEAPYIIKMFELRARGDLKDHEIVSEVNKMGYKSRIHHVRDRKDRMIIIGQRGGNKLDLKRLWDYIARPIYAGINYEKWTKDEPIKGKFEGLVSIELFNAANKGKMTIIEKDGVVRVEKERPLEWRLVKKIKNPDYPYKKYVLCPTCRYPFYGSASRGKLGKKYPAYHCNKRDHYFRIPAGDFEETIKNFVGRLKVTEEGIVKFKEFITKEWKERLQSGEQEADVIEKKIKELETQKILIGDKLTMLVSEEAVRLMEQKLKEVILEIKTLEEEKEKKTDNNLNLEELLEVVGYFLEHLEFLLLGSPNPLKRAAYFGLLFQEVPTYQELVSGTPKLAPYIELIQTLQSDQFRDCERLS